jgi:hypothetical protein
MQAEAAVVDKIQHRVVLVVAEHQLEIQMVLQELQIQAAAAEQQEEILQTLAELVDLELLY